MFAVGENIWKQAKPPVLFDSSRSASVMLGWHVQQNETNLIITEPGHESIAPQPVFKPMQNNSPSLQPALIKPLSLAHFHQRIHTEATFQPVSGRDGAPTELFYASARTPSS